MLIHTTINQIKKAIDLDFCPESEVKFENSVLWENLLYKLCLKLYMILSACQELSYPL